MEGASLTWNTHGVGLHWSNGGCVVIPMCRVKSIYQVGS